MDRRTGLVSIVTPAFDAEECLEETAATVFAQTYTDWEWLIADDGSSDGTPELVRRMCDRDPRVRAVDRSGASGSAAAARNRAMAVAQGEYIAFLDADDLWVPKKLELQVGFLAERSEFGGVGSWYEPFGDPERVRGANRNLAPEGPVRKRDALLGTPFGTSTLVIRGECYDTMGGMDEDPRLRSGQDYEYWFRLLTRYDFYRLAAMLVRWRLAADRASLSTVHRTADNARGWRILEVMVDKGLLDAEEQRIRRSFLHYEQARNNLLHLDEPFRGSLARSLKEGRPPRKAWIMASLAWLPAPALRRVLNRAVRRSNRRSRARSARG